MIEILNMWFKKLLLSVSAASLCSSALAEDVEDFSAEPLEEVVVSAFRLAPALELDASVKVLNQETIKSASLQHFEELIPLVPNMNLSGEGSRARYFQLRGIGELEQYEGAPNPSVGFVIDDIDLSGVGGVSSLFDVTQAEVLRGPQATRLGANAMAGLVYVQTANPTDQFQANVELTGGDEGIRGAGVAAGGPLGERLSGRVSVHQFRGNGFYDNVALGVDDSNERDELTARGKLAWAFGSGWDARLNVMYADYDNGYDAWSPENGRVTFSDNPGRDTQKTAAGSLKVSGPLSAAADFVSITGYSDSDILFSFDGEWGNEAYWDPYVYDYVYSDNRDRESLSQEFRILSSAEARILNGTTDWLLGIYAQRLEESNDILSAGIYDDSADAPYSFCTPCLDRSTLESAFESKNFALFGKLDTSLSDRASLAFGLRFERWQSDYADRFTDQIYGDPDQPVQHEFHPKENMWGGDLSLNYRVSEQARVYALVSRGYRAGGFNPSLARVLGPDDPLGPDAISFRPEYLWNYEIGAKGQWLDGNLSAEFSLFYMDRKDMQTRSSAQFTDNPNDFVFITSNGEGHSYGFEASAAWQIGQSWQLHGSLGLLETKIDAYHLDREAGIEGELAGREFAHAPPYTLNLGASYSGPRGWVGRVDYNAVGAFFFDYSHDEKTDDYRTVNLKLGKQWDHWAVYAWVRNLFDEEYHTRGFSFGLEPPWFARTRYTRLGDPRHYGLTVNYRY
jgi:outer membrane receptor protein involved in Fe transport